MKRVILIIADSLGVGAEPDAYKYGDLGSNTLLHAAENTEGFVMPNLSRLGMGNIDGAAEGRYAVDEGEIAGSFGKMQELSAGKDTTTGHWEIAGIETKIPFKTYPNGFPEDFIKAFQDKIGSEVLGNYPISGTEIIEIYGDEHEATGKPIVYTSADSVFQIAANIDVIPLERLYEICEIARGMLVGHWACGRVIARPYTKKNGKRIRTTDRRDFSVTPPEKTLLDKISSAGKTVYAIGKIHDIFNGRGCTKSVHTDGNMDGIDKTLEAMEEEFEGLIFTNLVDFDSLYGHRRNPAGYGKAIMELDGRIPDIIEKMKDDDVLVITADHGNDPVHRGFDHTREFVPVLVYGKNIKAGHNLGTRKSFADCGQTISAYLGVEPTKIGKSFLEEISL